jgi:4-diphosphocytidyl-2-C-methyl-D-erythritol kinase
MHPSLAVRAHAKINLSLDITGTRADGYHDLRTVFQALELHDTLTIVARDGPLLLESGAPGFPLDESNLVWKAAEAVWELAGRNLPPRDVSIRVEKRIPMQAGLGGGSADAAAALVALSRLWAPGLSAVDIGAAAARLGADVPFFLVGGAALGLGRGELLYPLADLPTLEVVLIVPPFGVSTAEAYRWYDDARAAEGERDPRAATRPGLIPGDWPLSARKVTNDLESPVIRRHPVIGDAIAALVAAGADAAAMSGSGSAVFGLFSTHARAARAVLEAGRRGWQAMLTRSLGHQEYGRLSRPVYRRRSLV